MQKLKIEEPLYEVNLKNERILVEKFEGQSLKQAFINCKFQLSPYFINNIASELVHYFQKKFLNKLKKSWIF